MKSGIAGMVSLTPPPRPSAPWHTAQVLWKSRLPLRVASSTGLAAVVSMLAAGMFEYNFGDSEFLMLFLILVTLPFAAARPKTV